MKTFVTLTLALLLASLPALATYEEGETVSNFSASRVDGAEFIFYTVAALTILIIFFATY